MIFYIAIVAGVILLMHLAQEQRNKIWIYAAILLLTLVAGMRAGSVGVDTEANITAFQMLDERGFRYVEREYLFYTIAFVLMKIFHNTSIVFLVFGFLIYYCIYKRLWELRKGIDLRVAGGLFALNYFGGTLNVMRQYIAVAIVFYATKYIKRGKLRYFLILVIVAMQFHISAFMGFGILLFYVDYKKIWEFIKNLSKRQMLCIGGALLGIMVLGILVIVLKYSHYLEDIQGFNIGLMSSVRVVLVIAAFIVFGRTVRYQKRFHFFFLIVLTGCIIGLTSGLLSNASRMGYYFRIFELVYYGMALKEGRSERIYQLGLMLVLAALGIYGLYTYGGILPYQTVLFIGG